MFFVQRNQYKDPVHQGLVLFSCSVMSYSLQPHGLQHESFTMSLLKLMSILSSLLRLMSTELVMPPRHLILCYPLLLLPSIFPSIRVFSSESAPSSGVGFDAVVAQDFSNSERGIKGYIQSILKDIFQYKPETYHIKGEGIDQTTTAFLINFANAGQWGYDAYIAPKASVQDGWLDVAIASEFPLVVAPGLALCLFTKTIDETLRLNTLRTKEITLTRQSEGVAHIDGTPIIMPAELHVKIVEDGLKVLVKKRF